MYIKIAEGREPDGAGIMIYQTPWGDWAFAAAGIISDGYASKPEAIRARRRAIVKMEQEVKRE